MKFSELMRFSRELKIDNELMKIVTRRAKTIDKEESLRYADWLENDSLYTDMIPTRAIAEDIGAVMAYYYVLFGPMKKWQRGRVQEIIKGVVRFRGFDPYDCAYMRKEI